jgi:Fe-S oxidoreductase
MWMDETIGKRINVTRVEQALPHEPKVIGTACPYCTVMMSDATKAMATDTGILTRDIAELVAGALQASGVDSRQGAGVGGG